MQARCASPSHTLVGNWVHSWPHDAAPGPNLDELHEIARFFDRHLSGVDNGWDDEPPIVWFEHEYAPPEPFPTSLPGRWRAATAYPHPETATGTWRLGGDGRLVADGGRRGGRGREPTAPPPTADGVDTFRHRPTTGTRGALSWGAGDAPNGLARDLRRDEDAGPTYTSEPLASALEVLGVPELVVHVEVDAPVAMLSVRLSDVAPDGIGRARERRRPEPDPPAVARRTRKRSWPAASRRSGSRSGPPGIGGCLGIVSASPSPRRCGRCSGRRPIRRRSASIVVPPPRRAWSSRSSRPRAVRVTPRCRRSGRARPSCDWPTAEALDGAGPAGADRPVWRIDEDVIAGSVTVHVHDGGEAIVPDGRRLYSAETLRMTAWDADPARAELEAHVVYRWQEREASRDGELTRIEIHADSFQTSTATDFELTVRLTVDVDGARFFERDWHEVIPRHLV